MSILSWDDFEDDSQKPAAPEHKSAPVEPQKATNSQVVSDERNEPSSVAAPQPARTAARTSTDSTDPLARASNALETLDVAPGLEELEMGAQRVQVDGMEHIQIGSIKY